MSRRSRERAEQAANEAVQAEAAPQGEAEQTETTVTPEAPRPVPRNETRTKGMEEIEALDIERRGLKEPEEVKVETPVEPVVEAAPVEPAAPEVPAMVKVKIDGVESEVSQADIDAAGGVNAYQKEAAAEKRLKAANEALAETRRIQAAQIAAYAQQAAPKAPPLTDAQFIKSKVDVIRFGSEEESAAALQEVLSRNRQEATVEMEKKMAVSNFQNEFPEIMGNPLLLRLAMTLENERGPQAPKNQDWNQFFRGIGNQVMSVVGRPHQKAETPTAPAVGNTSPPLDKEARKATITNLPTASTRAELPKETKPETREDVLMQMRKTRGIQN